jgi:hypothetical protein
MRRVTVLLALALLAGCGGSESEPLPLLPVSALPELRSTTHDIGTEELAADFGAGDKTFSGFVSGRERVFQGESHGLDRVVSRTLEFENGPAAVAYVDYFRSHTADVFGVGTNARTLDSDGRTGYLVDAASCTCHRAEPTLVAVVARGPRVTYLEVNGGGARPSALEALLAQAP